MKDPLTAEQKAIFIADVAEAWERKYRQVLMCNSLSEECGGYLPAKFALILLAEDFEPLLPDSRKELANLRRLGY